MPAADAAPAQQGQRAQSEPGPAISTFWKLVLGGIVYFGINFGINQVLAEPPQTGKMVLDEATGEMVKIPTSLDGLTPYQLRPKTLDPGAQYRRIPKRVAPIWPMDSYVDVVVTLSDTFVPGRISETPDEYLVFDEKHFQIGNWSDKRTIETTFTVPRVVQRNNTLWGHFFVGLENAVLDPGSPQYDPGSAYHLAWPLTQYIPKKPEAKARRLLDSNEPSPTAADEEGKGHEQKGPVIASYYHPNVSLSFIPDTGLISFEKAHPATRQFIRLEATGARDGSGLNSWYYPILFVNTFWQLKDHMAPLNDTVKELPLRIDLGNLANWKFTTMAAIEMSGQQAARNAAFGQAAPGGGDGSEFEMIKSIFLDTHPILLSITFIVSIAHIILETLAFGSDIAHYRKKKDNVGISVRSILVNAFMQTVIFLYLMDNSQSTSWVILGSQGVGIVIELWKITTVVNVRVRPSDPGRLLPYQIVFEDKHKLSETEQKTKDYDEIAFKYMYMGGVPLLAAYGFYSLYYETHKSWYSYVLATLVGSVYAYGFLMMVPSLYINYRLKSVAHMPAKAMMYKFLNTFIDDLFAFTIKMPWLHRLSTFRDDVIFFVYLYQKWAYKTDYTRVNEFGQVGDDEPAQAEAQPAKTGGEKEDNQEKAVKEIAVGGKVRATGTDDGKKATKRK